MKFKAAATAMVVLFCLMLFVGTAFSQNSVRTPEEVAQSLIDAYNRRDMDGILKAYAPDSTAYALPSGEVMLKGHEAIKKKFARVLEPNVKMQVEIVKRIVDGKFVIDREKITGTVDGKPREFYGTVIYEIRDGLIRNEWYLRQ